MPLMAMENSRPSESAMQSKHYQDYTSLTAISNELFMEFDSQFVNSRNGQEQLPYLQRFELTVRDAGYRFYQLSPPGTETGED